nr:alkaline phosphatase [Neobacillus notoginsengisoli]
MKKKALMMAAVAAIVLGTLAVSYFTGPNAEADSTYNDNHGKVKNVIFLIPDGFSASYGTNYRWFKGKKSKMDEILVGMHRTYSADTKVTDSAAAGTAMATGVKTNNGMISMSPDGKKLKSILETVEEKGKATGLIATTTITYATPAVFASHVASRTNEALIAPQLLENGVDVLLGGGKKYFPAQLITKAKKGGYHYISSRDELLKGAAKSNKLLGLFADDALAPSLDRAETNQPTLAEMTETAINILQKNKEGFFLMVEGSQIDWAGHDNDAAWAMNDVAAFEEALVKALSFAKKDRHTLVVVAGDHDTGGMSVGGYDLYEANVEILRNVTATGDYMVTKLNARRSNVKAVVKKYTGLDLTDDEVGKVRAASKPDMAINKIVSERARIGWTSKVHTGVDIPLYAYGPGSDLFRGLHENTDLPVLMAKATKIKFDGK